MGYNGDLEKNGDLLGTQILKRVLKWGPIWEQWVWCDWWFWFLAAVGSLGIMVLGGVGIGGSRYFPKAGILHPEAWEVARGRSPRAISRAEGCKVPARGKSGMCWFFVGVSSGRKTLTLRSFLMRFTILCDYTFRGVAVIFFVLRTFRAGVGV